MSVPRLKVCPNPSCGKPTKAEVSHYRVYRVCCEGCGMEGPMALGRGNRTEAVQLWNALPRAPTMAECAHE